MNSGTLLALGELPQGPKVSGFRDWRARFRSKGELLQGLEVIRGAEGAVDSREKRLSPLPEVSVLGHNASPQAADVPMPQPKKDDSNSTAHTVAEFDESDGRRDDQAMTLVIEDRREFRKTNDAIGIRVKEGRLSLLSRKIFNVLMFNAQEQREPGKNAPLDTAVAQKYFWMPLADLARDASYDSRDSALLKQHLQEMQGIRLVLEDKRQWTSENLISSVKLVNPSGLKNKHSGKVWVGYAFPPEVHELVMAPGTYTKLSIFYQGLLRTGAGLALYEICRKYLTNPSKLTNRDTYENWFVVLSGVTISGPDDLPLYKYFKRDVLLKAMAEINALTDIQVELVEHKTGRKITHLQFRVEHARQPQLEFPAPPFVDSELMASLAAVGMSQQDAQDAVATHGSIHVRQALRLLGNRMQKHGVEPLSSPLAYLRWALKSGESAMKELEGATKAKASKKSSNGPAGAVSDAGKALMDDFLAARARQAYAEFLELSDADQAAVFARFKEQSTQQTVKQATNTSKAMVRSLFSTWFAQDLHGEPTAAKLAAYLAERAEGEAQSDLRGRF